MGLRWYGIDIQKSIYMQTYFGLQQRHNPNISIISPVDSFVEIVLFWSYFFIRQKIKKDMEPLFRVMSLVYVLYVSIDRSKPGQHFDRF